MTLVCIDNQFWGNGDFINLSRKVKLLYLYVSTNPAIGLSGIYSLSFGSIENALWTNKTHAERMLKSLPGIEYDYEREIIYVRNHFRTAKVLCHDIADQLAAEISKHATPLWMSFFKDNPEVKALLSATELDKILFSKAESAEKVAYAPFVLLTSDEYAKLTESFGHADRDRMIQKHNAFKSWKKIENTENDYNLIVTYVAEKVKLEKQAEEKEGGPKLQYRKYVWLRLAEYEQLCSTYGTEIIAKKVWRLSNWKIKKHMDIGNDYARLINWLNKDAQRSQAANIL